VKTYPPYPKISVVIPAYNEELMLSRALTSVNSQEYPGEFEVLVVDNASTDKTAELARSLGARVLYEAKRGLPMARNTGYLAADGDIIAYTDADSILPPGWLRSFLKPFQDPQVVGVAGCFDYEGIQSTFARWFFRIYHGVFNHVIYGIFGLFGQVPFAGPNFAVLKSALDRVHGFDTSIPFWGEDVAIALRLKKAGKLKRVRFTVYSSGRRINQYGLGKFFGATVLNYLWILVFKKPYFKGLGPIDRDRSVASPGV
jgi:glycosyltransferase involved in cell wall biosynthesis